MLLASAESRLFVREGVRSCPVRASRPLQLFATPCRRRTGQDLTPYATQMGRGCICIPAPFIELELSRYFFGFFTTVIVNDDGYCLE